MLISNANAEFNFAEFAKTKDWERSRTQWKSAADPTILSRGAHNQDDRRSETWRGMGYPHNLGHRNAIATDDAFWDNWAYYFLIWKILPMLTSPNNQSINYQLEQEEYSGVNGKRIPLFRLFVIRKVWYSRISQVLDSNRKWSLCDSRLVHARSWSARDSIIDGWR